MRKSAAFTLIEVLIAVAIIAIALAAAIRATNQSIRVTRHVRTITTAHFVAMNVLSSIQVGLISFNRTDQSLHEKTKMLSREWLWTAHAQTVDQNIKRVTVTVGLKNRPAINTVTGFMESSP